MAPSRLTSTCPADGGNGVLESSNSKIARPPHSHLIKVRFVSAHRLFHFWNRTLKYYCADPAFEKALLVKEARGTCESEQKGSSFSRHALARPPRFSHFAKRTWKRMPHRQAGVVCGRFIFHSGSTVLPFLLVTCDIFNVASINAYILRHSLISLFLY